jgi:hypothetical protein
MAGCSGFPTSCDAAHRGHLGVLFNASIEGRHRQPNNRTMSTPGPRPPPALHPMDLQRRALLPAIGFAASPNSLSTSSTVSGEGSPTGAALNTPSRLRGVQQLAPLGGASASPDAVVGSLALSRRRSRAAAGSDSGSAKTLLDVLDPDVDGSPTEKSP